MLTFVSQLRGFAAAMLVASFVVVALGMGSTAEPVKAQSSATVDVFDFGFTPVVVTIEAGGTVTWVNNGAVAHTATGDGGEFDTGSIAPGSSASITFTTPGTYAYHCEFHPGMIATVVVLAVDDPDPIATALPDTGVGALQDQKDGIDSKGFLAVLGALILAGVGFLMRRLSRVLQ